MEVASERYGLNRDWRRLDTTQFRVPAKAGDLLALL
jgi:hypothetical protein